MELLACPQCVFDRMNPLWYYFVAVRLTLFLLFTFRSLDPIRVLGLLVLLEVPNYIFWTICVNLMYSAGPFGFVAVLIFSSCILQMLAIHICSKRTYFKRPDENALKMRWIYTAIPLFILSNFVHNAISYS